MSANLKPTIARLAAGETLTDDQAEAAFDIIMSGEATPAQIGALLMAMRLRGETVSEITGAVRAMRARMTAIEAPDGRDRCLRHRRRRRGHAERVLGGDLRGGRLRRAGGQARQPGAVVPHRRGRCADRAGGQRRCADGRPALDPGRGRLRLPVRPAPPSVDAPCRRPAGRTRHAHDLQPAGSAGQSGAGAAAVDRRVLPRLDPADGGNAGRAGA